MQTDFKVAIIGGGSAGLFAGALLSQKFHGNVAILERLDRVGKKLLATGNGQGNVTNTDLSLSHYHGDIRLAESVFSVASGKETSAILEGAGISLFPDERGRVYPLGRQASSVLDMLRKAFLDAGGKEITGAEIIRVSPKANGFTLTAKNGLSFTAQYVMIATGGKSGQGMGTDGAFYEVLKAIGHTVTPTRPSLVQLKTGTEYLKNLKGVRVYASLSGESATETGDVLFTDTGVSGDATFRLSARLTNPERGQVFVDFLPHLTQAELTELLRKKYRSLLSHNTYELLCTLLHKQIIKNVLRRENMGETERAREEEFLALTKALKRFPLTLKGTANFSQSQVTKGGVPASEVNPKTLESKQVSNLYLAGEVLNVDGDCGGYNLQWAFSSALAVVKAICEKAGNPL